MSGWGELMATGAAHPNACGSQALPAAGPARAQPLPRLLLGRMRIPRCPSSSSREEPAGGVPGATIPHQKTTRVPAPVRRRERAPGSRRKRGAFTGRAPGKKKPVPGFQGAWWLFFCTLRHKLIDRTPSYPGGFVSPVSGASTGGAGGLPGALLGGERLCKALDINFEADCVFLVQFCGQAHLYSGKNSLLAIAASPREGR